MRRIPWTVGIAADPRKPGEVIPHHRRRPAPAVSTIAPMETGATGVAHDAGGTRNLDRGRQRPAEDLARGDATAALDRSWFMQGLR
ncbi:MAG: hypothetical protein GX885_10440 [Methanomicrobiales archaeon]|nr:hypothetical protein [Methanomicrobiales archaeon]